MEFRITTLMENTADNDFVATEHGLSLLIQAEGFSFLYDTGGSPRFLTNAGTFGVDLGKLDALVLSHGHYDHTGGVAALFAKGLLPKKVFLGNHFFENRYSRKMDGLKVISALCDREFFERNQIQLNVVGGEPVKLTEGIWLVSGFKALDPIEKPLQALLREEEDGKLVVDPFEDEVAIVMETEKELALVSGCSHIGVLNMCRQTAEKFNRPVDVFIGGTHLMAADDRRIEETCEELKALGVSKLGACHCNGEKAGQYFEKHFPGFFRNRAGSVVTIG